MKQLWVLVGGNGAGKSTFHELKLKPLGIPFINADKVAKEIYPDDPEGNSYNAAKIAESMRVEQIQAGNSFCFETVFSHPSKIDFIAQAKSLGYQIILVAIHLSSPALNKARIAQRVTEGGHKVPDEKVESRIPRTLANIALAIPLCDQIHVLDNSRFDSPYIPVLTIKNGQVVTHIDPLPVWARGFVEY